MKTIHVRENEVIVDDDTFDWINGRTLRVDKSAPYAKIYLDGKNQYLHRIITSCPSGKQVDHINLNKLDNRRENLRIVTHAQNQKNQPLFSDNRSGYKGVDWMKNLSKWRARIVCDGREYHIGLFSDRKDAAVAYNEKAKEIHGQFARLNIIE
jgi:hypothetical protein